VNESAGRSPTERSEPRPTGGLAFQHYQNVVRQLGNNRIEITDIDLSAWLDLNGIPIVDARRTGRDFVITMLDPDERVPALLDGWRGSEASRFSSRVRDIKRLGAAVTQQAERRTDRGRGFRTTGPEVEVYDLDLSAWFAENGLVIDRLLRDGRETIAVFRDPAGRVQQLAVAWLGSQSSHFASRVRQIKKITLSTGRAF
jgi:hypothetical protein